MVIGIYGGSFDPIHSGHSILANFVSQCGVVDELWLTVCRQNPLKGHNVYANDTHRLDMARIVANKCKNVKVCDIEMSMPVPSYTIETLKKLKSIYPNHEFKVVIGSDSLERFGHWKDHDIILKDFGVVVYPRPGYRMPESEPDGMRFLNGAPEFGISSSLIREYVKDNWDINYFVPTEVAEYIRTNHLYER